MKENNKTKMSENLLIFCPKKFFLPISLHEVKQELSLFRIVNHIFLTSM